MRFSLYTFAAAALATLARAGSITIKNLDETTRSIVFTPSPGSPDIPTCIVPGFDSIVVQIPQSWVGNLYSCNEGAPNTAGILAEFSFNSWAGITFFDASTIVNPTDYNGVKKVFPSAEPENNSGCDTYETTCNNAYNQPDDTQTKSTLLQDFIVTVGNPSAYKRRHTRDFVLGARTLSAAAVAQ
jgi:hypothetical protein